MSFLLQDDVTWFLILNLIKITYQNEKKNLKLIEFETDRTVFNVYRIFRGIINSP